jgi:hypothetical protein
MKKLLSAFIILCLIVLIDWIFFSTSLLEISRLRYEILYFILISLLSFILLVNLTYKSLFSFDNSKLKIILIITLILSFSMFITNRALVINKYYGYSKKIEERTSGNLWKADDFLAHKGIANSVGYYEYFIGDSISGRIYTRFDSLGYRTVNTNSLIISDTLNLFLGCSFTFGDFIKAEEGYPYQTSKLLNNNFINGGASAYGLGQMIQLVDSLTPKFRFKYVFIQLSPWLADRAMELNGPTYYDYRPFPYFSETKNGFTLNYPLYRAHRFSKSKDWRKSERSYYEKIQFMLTDGFNVQIIDYLSDKFSRLKIKMGVIPRPTIKKLELEKYFYDYVINKVNNEGAIPIILKLNYPDNNCSELLTYLKNKATIIDLDVALDFNSQLNRVNATELYGIYHLHNGKKIYYDTHPNPYANEIISKYIFANLKK